MADYLTTVSPDYSATLSITPQGVVSEESSKSGVIHLGVDGSEERIAFGTTPIFFISFSWNILSESDSGTIFDWYNDSAKANGTQRSFKYSYGDGHIYTVRFANDLSRVGQAMSRLGVPGVRLKVLGNTT